MKFAWFIFIFWILFACQTSVEKEVSMDELSSPSRRYASVEDTTQKAPITTFTYDSISYFSKQLVDTLGISKHGVHRISTLLFPDRFNPLKSDKWYGITANDSFVYKHWMYVDSNVAENTFYNWLDNFGDKHLSLKFGDKMRVSPNAFVLLLQHRSVLFLESKNQLNKNRILSLIDTLGFGSTWKFVLFQNKGTKTEWFEKFNITSKNENRKS
jgi:hypothetical protein